MSSEDRVVVPELLVYEIFAQAQENPRQKALAPRAMALAR
jgi:hypothetical protein